MPIHPYRLWSTAKECPAGLFGIHPNPPESDPLPNPSASENVIPVYQTLGSVAVTAALLAKEACNAFGVMVGAYTRPLFGSA
jgi:hypothetical protein